MRPVPSASLNLETSAWLLLVFSLSEPAPHRGHQLSLPIKPQPQGTKPNDTNQQQEARPAPGWHLQLRLAGRPPLLLPTAPQPEEPGTAGEPSGTLHLHLHPQRPPRQGLWKRAGRRQGSLAVRSTVLYDEAFRTPRSWHQPQRGFFLHLGRAVYTAPEVQAFHELTNSFR